MGSPETQFFIRVSRIDAVERPALTPSANPTADLDPDTPGIQTTRDFFGVELIDDFVTHPTLTSETANAGWYTIAIDTALLPGAGKYSVDIMFDDLTETELRQAIDFARIDGANFYREKIDPTTISGFSPELDTSFEVIILKDTPPPPSGDD